MSRPPLGSTLSVFGLQIPWYSLLITIAILLGILLAIREEKRRNLPKDTIINFALLAIPFGIVGARLYYVAFTWNRFAGNWMEIFRVWNGGLAIYGGILGALLAAWIVSSKEKISFATLLDACAPSLALGQTIGRWGNYANMEAYGARIYNEAAQFFPNAVEIPIVGANGSIFWYWHMATFFYESVWCAVILCILWRGRTRMGHRGDVMLWYVLLYCAGRTVIEGLRDDSLLLNVAAAQVRISQILSALACLAVVIVFFVRLRRSGKRIRLADRLGWAIVALAIACTFVGEFERNAYQMLFIPAQVLLGVLLLCDIVFFFHYIGRAKRMTVHGVWMLVCAGMCIITLVVGVGRFGESNTAYVALRQAVCMAHVILCGAWFYLRRGQPRPVPAHEQANSTQGEMQHAARA